MADPQQVLSARVRDALVAAYGADYADADPLIRPSAFADFQSNAALPLAKRLGRAPRDIASEIAAQLDVDDIAEPPTVSGPGFVNLTLANDWIARAATEVLADPRLGVPVDRAPQDGHRRVLLAEHRQGDARRAPALDDRRRRHRPGDRVRGPPPDQGQPRRRLGHAVRHADRAPGRRGRGLTRGGPAAHRPERLLPGGAGQVRLRPGVRRPGAGSGSSSCSPATTRRRWSCGTELVEHVQGLPAGHLRQAAGHADRRRHQGRVVLQRHAARRRRRPDRQGPGQDQRRRAVRLPRGVHQPGRQRRCR